MSAADIIHDPARRRYSAVIDGIEAYLTYERPSPGVRHITHTIVPSALGGRGLGKQLVARILGDVMAADERVSSSCWFATGLIDTNPDWAGQRA